MKIALCFIISYDHILNKEYIWRDWIKANEDIINVYFYYKDITKIKSKWILEHVLPEKYIKKTSYFQVIPAYISLMRYALNHNNKNQWFCFLTDSCCPIISPKRFRYLFYKYYDKSIMSWREAWWNINYHKRANLALLSEKYRLANDSWFILKREDVVRCLTFVKNNPEITNTICKGGLANESLFAIILHSYNELKNVICSVTHMTDWNRMSSSTSPHLFKKGDEMDIKFIEDSLKENKFVVFIRKISPEFPDEIINNYIYNHSKELHDRLFMQPISFYQFNIIINIIIFMIVIYFFFIALL
jgi:hypothetical protein